MKETNLELQGMMKAQTNIPVRFYKTELGNEPVKDWLRTLDKADRLIIGADLRSVQKRWPLGMPLVRPLGHGLREIRSTLDNRIARLFFIICDSEIVILHGIIKKTQKTSSSDLELAKIRAKKYIGNTK